MYRAGTLIAATELCRRIDELCPEVRTDLVDEIIASSGLYDANYETYLAPGSPGPARTAPRPVSTADMPGQVEHVPRACVVGYGVAGRLHSTILADHGAALTNPGPEAPRPTYSTPELPARCRRTTRYDHRLDRIVVGVLSHR
ncbi:MAG: hypothetical protein ACRDTA_00205 [Pseudonocardiaceae bacterium]